MRNSTFVRILLVCVCWQLQGEFEVRNMSLIWLFLPIRPFCGLLQIHFEVPSMDVDLTFVALFGLCWQLQGDYEARNMSLI